MAHRAGESEHERLFERLLAANPPAFALLHRPDTAGRERLDVLAGTVSEVDDLASLPLVDREEGAHHQLLAMVPYRQISERGFACHDDGAPIIAMSVDDQADMPVAEAVRRLPDLPISLTDSGFDVDDESYAEIVRTVIRDEIGQGAGSNFVVKRSFTATIEDYSPRVALALFRRLLESELGAYWTFVVHTGSRTFVGATPERHVSLVDGTAVMNPISGTLRYPSSGPTPEGVMEFLADTKEAEELYMVVDEELKMMAKVCDAGGRVEGPYLKEMARLAHTEYLIEGRSSRDVREVLRETMFAPTVTGSPLENACRVLARHEPVGRGYYSGAIALIGRDDAGRHTLDSSILIRTADIDASGLMRIGVGATLVRHSDPESEVEETHAKAAGLLAATGMADAASRGRRPAGAAPAEPIGDHPGVRAALARRNDRVARFWLAREADRVRHHAEQAGTRIFVVDAEDAFTAMLGHQLRALGTEVRIRPYHQVTDADLDGADIVVVGPGPGDPLDGDDPKIATLRGITRRLRDGDTPFLSVCLGHQVLAHSLGFPVMRKSVPSQGLQREIDLFGRPEHVGFYNTFTARAASDQVHHPGTLSTLLASRDPHTGEVHALRGPGFASAQFHPESLLTQHGPDILTDMLGWAESSHPRHDAPALAAATTR
jgi:phenazine biosynthesis protein phzE